MSPDNHRRRVSVLAAIAACRIATLPESGGLDSVSSAYHPVRDLIHLPRYPRYASNASASLRGDFRYFYRRSEQYLGCQESRFVLVGGDVTTLVDEHVVDPLTDLSSWWQGWFRERFHVHAGEVVKYRGGDGYRQALVGTSERPVLTPYPYDSAHIPSERYYLERPTLMAWLNDKSVIAELTDRTPRHQLLSHAELLGGLWRDEWRFPFIVKLTEPSGGGDGVIRCCNDADLQRAARLFAGRSVKLEAVVDDPVANYNINIHVAADGTIRLMGGSRQLTDADGRYMGNLIDLNWTPSVRLWRACRDVAEKAAARGWYGICGFDVLEDHRGEYFFIDLNFRLNGSTPFFLLADGLRDPMSGSILRTGYFHAPGTPTECLDRLKGLIDIGVFLPLGIHFDPKFDGVTRMYGSLRRHCEVERSGSAVEVLSRLGLNAGIGL